MDSSVLLEALSCLTGQNVNLHTDSSGIDIGELTVQNFVSSAFLPLILCRDEPSSNEASAGTSPDEVCVNLDNFYAPKFNYDFRNYKEKVECTRGGEPYTRPAGWYRFALNVLNKYPDGNSWLGPGGWRNNSEPGEWPVSYHGTGKVGQMMSGAPDEDQEYGIYSTPDVEQAERDGELHKEFTSKNGKSYRVIMQNRINPDKRIKKTDKLWLVKIPLDVYALREEERRERMKNIVDDSIRPYGILIKEI